MSDAPITPKFQQMAPVIMQGIMARLPHLTDEDAASPVGNFGQETGGFMLRLEEGKPKESQGVGWAQWTGYDDEKSNRRKLFEEFCRDIGYSDVADYPATAEEERYNYACFEFFIHEVTQSWEKRVFEGPGATVDGVFYDPVPDCPTLEAKTISFMQLYERPGTPHEDRRIEMAREALRLYRGEGLPPPIEEPDEENDMRYGRICISSGHGLYVRGASGILDEVDEARLIAEALAEALRERGVWVDVWHDDISTSQSENLDRIVDHHNSCERELDISVHLNAFEQREQCVGSECLYVTQSALAAELSAAMAEAMGVPDRGGKYNGGLAFLNNTAMPSVLLEVVFVDSECDAEHYRENWDELIEALATVLGGEREETEPPTEPVIPPDLPERPERPLIAGRIDMEISGDVVVIINGQKVWP